MKFDIQKFMDLNKFLLSQISNFFQKGKKMKTANALVLLVISLMFALSSCMNPQNEEQPSSEGPVVLEINLGGNSRAERFLGTFDQINRMSLDIKRVYGNKMINTDLELSFDNNTGNWKGTVNNLIVGFDYEITGHAYRLYDNVTDDFVTAFTPKDNSTKFVEIFQGSVTHTVQDGLNTLNLRLSPILDSRNLSVPRITHIYRPFQMVASTNDNITVKVSTVSKYGSNSIDASLNFIISMFKGTGDTTQLGGPIKIAKITGQVAKLGFIAFLSIMAYISISLGFINLLPIPMLDGGHLMFYAFEKVLGRPLTQRTQEGFFRIGLFLLLSLMFFTTFNDLRDLGLF